MFVCLHFTALGSGGLLWSRHEEEGRHAGIQTDNKPCEWSGVKGCVCVRWGGYPVIKMLCDCCRVFYMQADKEPAANLGHSHAPLREEGEERSLSEAAYQIQSDTTTCQRRVKDLESGDQAFTLTLVTISAASRTPTLCL